MFAVIISPAQLNFPKHAGEFQSTLQWYNCAAHPDISGSQDDKSLHIALKVPQHVGGMCQSQKSSPNEPCSLWCFCWRVFLALNEYFRCLMQKKVKHFSPLITTHLTLKALTSKYWGWKVILLCPFYHWEAMLLLLKMNNASHFVTLVYIRHPMALRVEVYIYKVKQC